MSKIVRKRNKIKLFFLVVIFGLLPFTITSCNLKIEYVRIVKVIDGDTFEDDKNLRYRLLGVDTPESFDSSNNFQSTIGIRKFYATKATNLSLETILNKDVIMKTWKLDSYKRMVTRINIGSIELAQTLLSKGFARVKYISPIENNFFYYPDINYYNQLINIETNAKVNKLGIWKLSKNEQTIVFPK